MNILITGAAGFIGRHVVKLLRPTGHTLWSIDRYDTRVHGDEPEADPDFADIVFHDEYWNTPYQLLQQADIVIHLAAQVGVADSMQDQTRYMRHNALGTARFLDNLGEIVRDGAGPQKLVVASSMSIYGDPHTNAPIDELQPAAPASVYGLSKYSQEQQCLYWGQVYDIPVHALRFFNVYGPGQSLDNPYTGVIANFMRWLLDDEQPLVYEDGKQTRDFIYVEDVADAVYRVALAEKPVPQILNISTGRPTTIVHMARTLARALGKSISPNVTGIQRPGDIRHCIGSNTLLRSTFPDWHARWVDQGIGQYVDWVEREIREGAILV